MAKRMAVIGHVEWAEFAVVERVPLPGEIVHATETFQEPAGGGAVAAVQLAKLAGEATLYTALGDDALGRKTVERLATYDVRVEAVFRPRAQRRAFVYLDAKGERTITTIGERMGPHGADPLPWHELADTDGVYFTAGDGDALRAGRAARALVATSRVLRDLAGEGVLLDALVGSGRDPAERYEPGSLQPAPRLVVVTAGSAGGTYITADGHSGHYVAQPPPGPIVDAYGSGDSFAAGLTFALGAGYGTAEALTLAARCGAACASGRGPYQGQLRLAEDDRSPCGRRRG